MRVSFAGRGPTLCEGLLLHELRTTKHVSPKPESLKLQVS